MSSGQTLNVLCMILPRKGFTAFLQNSGSFPTPWMPSPFGFPHHLYNLQIIYMSLQTLFNVVFIYVILFFSSTQLLHYLLLGIFRLYLLLAVDWNPKHWTWTKLIKRGSCWWEEQWWSWAQTLPDLGIPCVFRSPFLYPLLLPTPHFNALISSYNRQALFVCRQLTL